MRRGTICTARCATYGRTSSTRQLNIGDMRDKILQSPRGLPAHNTQRNIRSLPPDQGETKATELAKVARREGERFEITTWVHKAQVLPKEEFKREVERHLKGKETEAWEIIYFKLYKSQYWLKHQSGSCGAWLP